MWVCDVSGIATCQKEHLWPKPQFQISIIQGGNRNGFWCLRLLMIAGVITTNDQFYDILSWKIWEPIRFTRGLSLFVPRIMFSRACLPLFHQWGFSMTGHSFCATNEVLPWIYVIVPPMRFSHGYMFLCHQWGSPMDICFCASNRVLPCFPLFVPAIGFSRVSFFFFHQSSSPVAYLYLCHQWPSAVTYPWVYILPRNPYIA